MKMQGFVMDLFYRLNGFVDERSNDIFALAAYKHTIEKSLIFSREPGFFFSRSPPSKTDLLLTC